MTAISSSEETGFFRDNAENNYKTLKKKSIQLHPVDLLS